MPVPDFFLIGAPKTGTTSIYHWLSNHPDVFLPKLKEPAFFAGFGRRQWRGPGGDCFPTTLIADPADYDALFAEAGASQRRGDASTDYLWVEDVPQRIAEYCPGEDLRFIVVLRDPCDRAFSEHSHLLREGREGESFIRSLELEESRFEQNYVPLFYHRRRGQYAAALKRYFDTFGRDHVLVVRYEQLKQTAQETFDQVCGFLDLPACPLPARNIVYNKSGRPKSAWLHQLIRGDSWAKRIAQKILGGQRARRMRDLADQYNLTSVRMTAADRTFAMGFFREDVRQTEALLGWNVSDWLRNDLHDAS